MKVKNEDRPNREAKLDIALEPGDVDPYLTRAYTRSVKRLNVPGFRKGKAPRHVIDQLYGREFLLNEALSFMVPEVTNEAILQADLKAIGASPSVTINQLDPLTLTAIVPLKPTVELGDFQTLRIPKNLPAVGNKQIANVVEQIRWENAPWEPAISESNFGDLMNISVNGWLNDDSIMSNDGIDYIPRENSRMPVPGFAEALLNHAPEEILDFSIDVPVDFENQQIAGQQCRFNVRIHEVKRKTLPQLNDEFAKGVGEGYASLKELRKVVKQDLVRQEEQAIDLQYQEEVLDALVEKANVDFSPLLTDHEVEHELENYAEAIRSGRVSMEHYQRQLEWAGKSETEVRESIRPQVVAKITRGLLIHQLIEEEPLTVDETEMDTEITRFVESAGPQAAAARKMFESPEGRENLTRTLLNRKALQFLVNVAQGKSSSTRSAPGNVVSRKPKKPKSQKKGKNHDV